MKFERFIEGRFGYTLPWVFLASSVVMLRQFWMIVRSLQGSRYRKRLSVSFGPAAYLEPLVEVIEQLVVDGWRVLIFPEWETYKYSDWGKLKGKYPSAIFVENSSRALPFIRSKVFLSSVAGKHFYFPKSARRIFYFHSLAGLTGFPDGGLDSYEYFLCATSQQENQLTERRKTLGLSLSGILQGGYPRYDSIAAKIASHKKPINSQRTLVYAPTYQDPRNSVAYDIEEIGKAVLSKAWDVGFYVIFRPHPLTVAKEELKLVNWFTEELGHPSRNGHVDLSEDYFETYSQSEVMVTDLSGGSVVFGTVFKKKVIFFGPNQTQLDEMLEGWRSVGVWAEDIQALGAHLATESWSVSGDFRILEAGKGAAAYKREISRIAGVL